MKKLILTIMLTLLMLSLTACAHKPIASPSEVNGYLDRLAVMLEEI